MIASLLLSGALLSSNPGALSIVPTYEWMRLSPGVPSPYYNGWMATGSPQISIWTDLLISADKLPVQFGTTLLRGREVTDAIKTKASSKLGSKNEIGLHFNSGVRARFNVDSARYRVALGVQQMRIGGVQFTDDLFNLVFFGNAMFENQTAQFHPLNYSAFSYNQFLIGLSRTLNIGHKAWVSLSLEATATAGTLRSSASTTRGTLYTAPDGEYVDMDAAFIGEFSDTSRTSGVAFNGSGAGLNFGVSYGTGRVTINASVEDLGFIAWNDQTLILSMDNALHFEGFDANTFFDTPDNFFSNIEDSLRELAGLQSATGSLTTSLPTRTTFVIGARIPKAPLHLSIGGTHSFVEPYVPMIFLKTTAAARKLEGNASLTLTYGGFGGFNVGLEATKSFGARAAIALGFPSLPGLFAPSSFSTTGGWLTASLSL